MSKTKPAEKPAAFKRKGDLPRTGGSFVRQSDGSLKPKETTDPVDPTNPAPDSAESKDSGK